MLTGSGSAASRALLQQKEQEINLLRENALVSLESKLHEKEVEVERLGSKFKKLSEDFEYNMKLLEDRDAELDKYDSEHAGLVASLESRDVKLAELLDALTQAQSELKAERAHRQELEFVSNAKHLELQRSLEDHKISFTQALIQQKESGETERRSLHRALVEAEEEVGRQRREMAAEFTVQSQRNEALLRKEVEDAKQEAKVSQQLAWQRENEAKGAYQREAEQRRVAEAAVAEFREKEKAGRALTWELDQTRELKDGQIRDQSEQMESLKHQLKMLNEESSSRQADLAAELAESQRTLEGVRLEAAASSARQQSQHREEVAVLRAKLEQAQAQVAELGSANLGLSNSLKHAKGDSEDIIAALEQELRLQREAVDMALADSDRRRDVAIHQLQGELAEKNGALLRLQGRGDGVMRTLTERHAELETCKDQLTKAGQHERELRRKLDVVEALLEEAGDNREAVVAAQTAGQMRTLVEKLEAANQTLKDTQSRLTDRESDVHQLRDRIRSLMSSTPRSDSDAELSPGREKGGRSRDPAATSWRPQPADDRGGGGREQDQSSGSPHRRPPRISLPAPTQEERMQESLDSLPNLPDMMRMIDQGMGMVSPSVASIAGLDTGWSSMGRRTGPPPLSPLGDNSPRGSGSPRGFLLGTHGLGGPVNAMNAAAAAARAADYLRASEEGVTELLRPPRLGSSSMEGALANVEEEHVKTALLEAVKQNDRLRTTLAMMREEMEALQAAASAAAQSFTIPHDLALLKAELEESDHDLAQALRHIQVLQLQLGGGSDAQGGCPAAPHLSASLANVFAVQAVQPSPPPSASGQPGGPLGVEVGFLRERVHELSAENRLLRRQAVQLKVAATKAADTNRQNPAAATPEEAGNTGGDHAVGALPVTAGASPSAEWTLSLEAAMADFEIPGARGVASLRAGHPATTNFAVPGAGGASPPPARAADVKEQRQALNVVSADLAATRSQLSRLREENEKLMEMGSALRSERDRLAVQLAAALSAEDDVDEMDYDIVGFGAPTIDRSHLAGMSVGSHLGTSPTRTAENAQWKRHAGSLATAALVGGHSAQNPFSTLMAAAAFSGPSSGLSFGGAAPPPYFTSSASPNEYTAPYASSPPRQPPVPLTRPPAEAENQEPATATTSTAGQIADQEDGGAPDQQRWDRTADGSRTNDRASSTGGGGVTDQRRSTMPPGDQRSWPPPGGPAGGRADEEGGYFSEGALDGPFVTTITAGPRPPSTVPGSASSRETLSQREKLRELQRKRDEQMAMQAAILNKPKVRNYNMRDTEGGEGPQEQQLT